MKAILLILILVIGGGAYLVLTGESKPKTPQEQAFDAANSQIFSDKGGVAYGNSAEAKATAKAFSEMAGTLEQMLFTGGKENRAVSMTGERFLTYCQLNQDSVLFLVHVPQFKRYKDDVREALLEMCWTAAIGTLPEGLPPETKVAIGLRGSIMYGGIIVGTIGGETQRKTMSAAVDESPLYAFFPAPAGVSPQAVEASAATPDDGLQPPPTR